jgi:hypothetical protein
MLYDVMLRYIMLYYIISYHTIYHIFYHTISYNILYYIIYIIFYNTISYNILYYNLTGPPSYMRSVIDRNVVMRRMAVLCNQPQAVGSKHNKLSGNCGLYVCAY